MSDLDPGVLDYPIGYRSLVTLNEHRSTAGAEVVAQRLSTYLVERFDFSRLQLRDQKSGLHLVSGGDFGAATKVFRFISLLGMVKDTTQALLEDRISRLIQTFDIEEAQYASITTQGVSRLDFYSPTNAPASGFTSPVHEMFLCRPNAHPQIFERRGNSLSVMFALELVCADHRRYLYASTTKTANAGNSWSVACPNWDANMGEMTYPVLTLTLTGTGSAACTIVFTPTTVGSAVTLVLDLSSLSAAAHTVDIDTITGMAYLDGSINPLTRVATGTRRDDFLTSDPDTILLGFARNGGVLTVPSGRTALTSVAAEYRQARA